MFIYKIINIENNKIYIGFTTQTLDKRWAQHISSSKKPKHYFHNAINKYGPEKFEINILEKCSSMDELKQKEIIWIAIYNSANREFGYNSTKGGEGIEGYKHTQETCIKMSIAKKGEKHPNYGKHRSLETKFKLSIANLGKKHPMFGKHHSPETCAKISAANKGEKHYMFGKSPSPVTRAKTSKPVLQYDKQGNFIKEWCSMSQVDRELKIEKSDISKVCEHKRKSAGGFVWKFKNIAN